MVENNVLIDDSACYALATHRWTRYYLTMATHLTSLLSLLICTVLLLQSITGYDIIQHDDSYDINTGLTKYIGCLPGTMPLILTVPHGGYLKPADIPDRGGGCWDTNNNKCIYTHTCSQPDIRYVEQTSQSPSVPLQTVLYYQTLS